MTTDILNADDAEFIGFYGSGPGKDSRLRQKCLRPREHTQLQATPSASTPDTVPSLFVEAWNRRDPDSLASLFDEDADLRM